MPVGPATSWKTSERRVPYLPAGDDGGEAVRAYLNSYLNLLDAVPSLRKKNANVNGNLCESRFTALSERKRLTIGTCLDTLENVSGLESRTDIPVTVSGVARKPTIDEGMENKRVQPLVAQIGWTHTLVIFQRCKDPLEREFYLRMTRKFGWSKSVLVNKIDNFILCFCEGCTHG